MSKKTPQLPNSLVSGILASDEAVIYQLNEQELATPLSDGRNALFYAVINLNINLVIFILNKGVSPSVQDKLGWSPLHYASQNQNVETINLLLDFGANINCQDNYGNTPLWRAVFNSKGIEISRELASAIQYFSPYLLGFGGIFLLGTILKYGIRSL